MTFSSGLSYACHIILILLSFQELIVPITFILKNFISLNDSKANPCATNGVFLLATTPLAIPLIAFKAILRIRVYIRKFIMLYVYATLSPPHAL